MKRDILFGRFDHCIAPSRRRLTRVSKVPLTKLKLHKKERLGNKNTIQFKKKDQNRNKVFLYPIRLVQRCIGECQTHQCTLVIAFSHETDEIKKKNGSRRWKRLQNQFHKRPKRGKATNNKQENNKGYF